LSFRASFGEQAGDGLLIASNHQFLSLRQMLNELGQFGLGFFDTHSGHVIPPVGFGMTHGDESGFGVRPMIL
jgi:hypothetical protein